MTIFFVNIAKDFSDWFYRLIFFWLAEGPKRYWKLTLGLSAAFEDGWATFITLRNLFAPLYQDYSIIGRLLGPFFRLGRFAIGLVIHGVLLGLYALVFLVLCLIFWGAPFLFVINLFIWNQ